MNHTRLDTILQSTSFGTLSPSFRKFGVTPEFLGIVHEETVLSLHDHTSLNTVPMMAVRSNDFPTSRDSGLTVNLAMSSVTVKILADDTSSYTRIVRASDVLPALWPLESTNRTSSTVVTVPIHSDLTSTNTVLERTLDRLPMCRFPGQAYDSLS